MGRFLLLHRRNCKNLIVFILAGAKKISRSPSEARIVPILGLLNISTIRMISLFESLIQKRGEKRIMMSCNAGSDRVTIIYRSQIMIGNELRYRNILLFRNTETFIASVRLYWCQVTYSGLW